MNSSISQVMSILYWNQFLKYALTPLLRSRASNVHRMPTSIQNIYSLKLFIFGYFDVPHGQTIIISGPDPVIPLPVNTYKSSYHMDICHVHVSTSLYRLLETKSSMNSEWFIGINLKWCILRESIITKNVTMLVYLSHIKSINIMSRAHRSP